MDNISIFDLGCKYCLDTNGEFHCEFGPAIEHPSGKVFYYLHGRYYSLDAYCKELNLSDEDKVVMKLKYG